MDSKNASMARWTLLAFVAFLLPACMLDVSTIEDEEMRPPSRMADSTGWSQSGQLIAFASGAGVTMQKEFPIPGNYTVQFGFDDVPVGAVGIRRPLALVAWSVEGNTVLREITAQNGTSISGQAEAVSVKLFDDLVNTMAGVPGTSYNGTIQISKGIRAGSLQAPIFFPREWVVTPGPVTVQRNGALQLTPAQIGTTRIPSGATQVAVFSSATVATDNPLDAGDVRATAVSAGGNQTWWFPEGQWVSLPAQSQNLSIFNDAAFNIEVSCIFGIDG